VLADLHHGGMITWIGSDITVTVVALAVAAAFIHDPRQAGQLGRWVEGIRRAAPLREMPGARMSAAEARAIDDYAHLEAYNTYLSALGGTSQPMAGADTPPGG
jgi:hypothetical protein